MGPLRDEPFPFEAVRDLLGILRALYAATPASRTRRRNEIQSVAAELKQAVDLALEFEPHTLGHAAAWSRAEDAVTRLADLVDLTTPMQPVLEAASRRVRSKRR